MDSTWNMVHPYMESCDVSDASSSRCSPSLLPRDLPIREIGHATFITILGFAFISEIPWFLLNGYDGTHNVMFTLVKGVVALAVFDRLCDFYFI